MINDIPLPKLFTYATKLKNETCANIFLKSIEITRKQAISHFTTFDRKQIENLSHAVCKTSNPSSYWLIAKVESNFNPRVIRINSNKKVLYGEKAEYYLKTTQIKNDENLDIGIFQINWKHHRSHSKYRPNDFFDVSYSLVYVTNWVIPIAYQKCKINWISCYHSFNKDKGDVYKMKINKANLELRLILNSLIKQSTK